MSEPAPVAATADIVDLAELRAQARPPDGRVVIELWRLADGTGRWFATLEGLAHDGRPAIDQAWLAGYAQHAVHELAERSGAG